MVFKIKADLPAELCEKALLDLSIRGRTRGDSLILWEEDEEQLTVLFDGKVGYSLEDYIPAPYLVAPGTTLIFDKWTHERTAGKHVAGIVLDGPNHMLSYHFQQRWGGRYGYEARLYNQRKTALPLKAIWINFCQMNFAWYQNQEDIDQVFETFQSFENFISTSLVGLETHIPLVEDPADLISMN